MCIDTRESYQALEASQRCVGMADQVRWIRSYVLEEGGGSVGTVCIYRATSPEALREHASRATWRWTR